jgi:hypothetical protein
MRNRSFRQPIGKERLSLNMVVGTGVSGPGIRWYLFHSGMVTGRMVDVALCVSGGVGVEGKVGPKAGH